MCPLPKGFQDKLFHCTIFITGIKERQDALRRAKRHVLIRVAKCIHVDGGIFENVLYILGKLYQLCRVNNKYRY
jgi:hypothetical protein